jgi:hypothetical protein
MIWICSAILVVGGLILSIYGAETWDLGWYSDRAFVALIGVVAFTFGLFCFACAIWPEQMRILLIGY